MSDFGVKSYQRGTYGIPSNIEDLIGQLTGGGYSAPGTPTDQTANTARSQAQRFLTEQLGPLQDYYRGLTERKAQLPEQQYTAALGQQLQRDLSNATSELASSPYIGGARSGADLLGKAIQPSITGLSGQLAQSDLARQGLGLQGAQGLSNIPGMIGGSLAPSQYLGGLGLQYAQLGQGAEALRQGALGTALGGYDNLLNSLLSSQELYTQPSDPTGAIFGTSILSLLGSLLGGQMGGGVK